MKRIVNLYSQVPTNRARLIINQGGKQEVYQTTTKHEFSWILYAASYKNKKRIKKPVTTEDQANEQAR